MNVVGANAIEIEEKANRQNLTDVYICVFFDGTGNNMYEQVYKKNKVKDLLIKSPLSAIKYSAMPGLFVADQICQHQEKLRYGMTDYEKQKEQAEKENLISENRDDNEGNGGWKYSNVAILKSLTKKMEGAKNTSDSKGNKVIGISYNIYIEGSGKGWDASSDLIGLGMGTGKTGVVALVSKSMVLISNFLNSNVDRKERKQIKVHFAIFGFSRGSTCGRLLSFLIAEDGTRLPKKDEFKQFLPSSLYKNGHFRFLEDYDKKGGKITVDFLGIYDTVSSIGFLLKNDNSTDAGMNQFKQIKRDGKNYYVNFLHSGFGILTKKFRDAYDTFHCDNTKEYGLYSPRLKNVKHTFHICAIDEFRENFALVDLGKDLEGKNCTEVFIPGCHSDVGGGYMDGDDIDRYSLRRRIKGLPTRMIETCDPKGGYGTQSLSQDLLLRLGWFTTTAPEATRDQYQAYFGVAAGSVVKETKLDAILAKGDKNTIEQTTYINQWVDKIEFERFAKEGYSNIPLQMMIERAVLHPKVGLKDIWPIVFLPFNSSIPIRFKSPSDYILGEIKSRCRTVFEEGQRFWIIPSSLNNYAEIRRKYLHFTCTDDLNLEKGHFKASGANIGNAPNWKKMNDHYLLCRIVYHGDMKDNSIYDMTSAYR